MSCVAAFYDAGNVGARAGQFNPPRLLRGAGIGLSIISPLGPIGIDWAYGFDRTNVLGQPAPGWKLHFKLGAGCRSEEHTSELQSRLHLVCRLLLEKKKQSSSSPASASCWTPTPSRTRPTTPAVRI